MSSENLRSWGSGVESRRSRKERLCRAYVLAVASAAGYALAEQNFDRDGVDIQVRAGGAMRPSLDMQLKATVRLKQHGDDWRFPLPRRNHDLLREATMVPRVLVVLEGVAPIGWTSLALPSPGTEAR